MNLNEMPSDLRFRGDNVSADWYGYNGRWWDPTAGDGFATRLEEHVRPDRTLLLILCDTFG